MAMFVGKINPIIFKGAKVTTTTPVSHNMTAQVDELSCVTPDFAVKTPQKYSKIGMFEFGNGLKVHSYKLANGYRVTIVPMEDSPTIVKNYVNVGSMNETDDIKGISHFLEHMAFNGTNGSEGYLKLNQGDSFKKIDELGGWTNASTNYAITDYVNSTQLLEDGSLEKQLQIIASMSDDLALSNDMIEKEKGPVSSEINMILDDPQTIVMDQTIRSLFNIKSSADELVGGSVNHIQNLNREKVKEYYDKYYTPDNMNLVITGNVDPQKTIEIVSKLFKSNKRKVGSPYEEKMTPISSSVRKDFITDKAVSTDMMMGFAGPKSNDVKSAIIFKILSEYLYSTKTNFNKELQNLNTRFSFGLEKISTNPNNPTLISCALNSSENRSEESLKTAFDILSNLKAPQSDDLETIKERIIQNFRENMDYSSFVNDIIGTSVLKGSVDSLRNYEQIVQSITSKDVQDFIDKYLDVNKVALTLVHPETTENQIRENYSNGSKVSFKRRPLDTSKVSTKKLDNNIELNLIKTKNQNSHFFIECNYDIQPKNPATEAVLNEIYDLMLEDDSVKSYLEDNNIDISYSFGANSLYINGYSGNKNAEKAAKSAIDKLVNPIITQKLLDKAIFKIKDDLNNSPDTASSLYNDFNSKHNKFSHSKSEILDGLKTITLDDVKNYHSDILNNSSGTIYANVPETNPELEETIINSFQNLPKLNDKKIGLRDVFKENKTPVVLTKARPVSQAEIIEVFKFKAHDNPKDAAIGRILNYILSSSHSIGLFDVLREKEHLAYSVHSSIDSFEDCGEMRLNILTTTDNKETGECPYDNLQKSIDGFNRQIGELLKSNYTDDDLENAKKYLKASLLDEEGGRDKLWGLEEGNNSLEGIEWINKVYESIDSITRKDIDNFSKEVFKDSPIYSIVASQDTLDKNRDYLNSLR
jgi:predicted Zn-dependent peptidase